MPIFEKGNRRVYFAHIPKTAGTSLYLAFAASGWTILNLNPSTHPNSAFMALNRELGIKGIEMVGDRFGYPNSIQHSPHWIWKSWGPYTESFAIIRHPHDRLMSALKYHYHLSWKLRNQRPFEDFVDSIFRSAIKKPFRIWRLLDGHLMRQSEFISPTTVLFRFESNWKKEICQRYDLRPETLVHRNAGEKSPVPMTQIQNLSAQAYYAPDYWRFGYLKKQSRQSEEK